MKILPLFAMAACAAFATPLFPDFGRDSVSIQGSPLIGRSIVSPGRYLFALEDLRVTNLTVSDYDYNDLYGELVVFDNTFSFYSINVQGGLGSYFINGQVGFAGARFVDGIFTLVFNTPSGEMFSGTNQVLIYCLDCPHESAVPEPATYAMIGAGVLAILWIGARKKFNSDYMNTDNTWDR